MQERRVDYKWKHIPSFFFLLRLNFEQCKGLEFSPEKKVCVLDIPMYSPHLCLWPVASRDSDKHNLRINISIIFASRLIVVSNMDSLTIGLLFNFELYRTLIDL